RRKRRSKAKAAWSVASLLPVEPKAAAGAAANVAHGDGPKGAGQPSAIPLSATNPTREGLRRWPETS
ncbi:TPA: hypothetical protein ACKP28_004606, partial [Stenotrophomonas maltophilia]